LARLLDNPLRDPPEFTRLSHNRINLYSDTQTRPTRSMRQAMADAEVGDEQSGDDPTVNLLCERVAALLGKERALFLPTGTMANQISIAVHCRPGDEILAHHTAHILSSEGGAGAAITGVQITGLSGERGIFTPDQVRLGVRPRSRYSPPTRLVAVEQTANLAGGSVWSRAELDAVAEVAHGAGLATHMDGARLMNAVVASGESAAALASGYDSVWLDFTKGLGAPLGAALAGSGEFIEQAWRWKQRLGGSLRQAGIVAAGCLFSLDHHVDRLADDHANARLLADGLSGLPGVTVQRPETNLVFFEVADAERLVEAMAERGVRIGAMGPGRVRVCTHLDVSREMVVEALTAFRAVLAA